MRLAVLFVRLLLASLGLLLPCIATHAADTIHTPLPSGVVDFPFWHKAVIAVPPSSTGLTYYVDGKNGSDANDGMSPTTPFKTIAQAVLLVAAGDTVLIRAGLYREGINLVGGPSGVAGKPITFGSYGDGEVILDGSTAVTGWTKVSGTVWHANLAFTPVGIVVNEVPLKQVRQGQGGSTAPQEGIAGVTSGSGKWYYAAGVLTADFGTTIGAGDPNTADIVVPNSDPAQQHVFWYGVSYVTFKGLTVRGSGANGLWGYGANIIVDSCDIKFNGKAAVVFLSGVVLPNSDNAVLMSHAYHNVLINWPRGNNGFAEAGGGWPGALGWQNNLRPLARGNVVHMNGGEGIISYGTVAGVASGSALFEQNIAFDNWSVNLYFDNQPNDVARNNFLSNHPPDPANFLYVGAGYPYDSLDKYSVCLMLADEQNSSDSTNGFANLRGSQVYNNILANCRIGIRDYSEGTSSIANHGLKDTVITNNTIIMGFTPYSGGQTFGIYLQDNGTKNVNSFIRNNVIVGFNDDAVIASAHTGAIPGVTIDYNGYFSTSTLPFWAGFNTITRMNFAQWQSTMASDAHGIYADMQLTNVAAFRSPGTTAYDFNAARPLQTSPARIAGTTTGAPGTDFSLFARPIPPSLGALEPLSGSLTPTGTALVGSASLIIVGQPVTFTATVTPSTATGVVTFSDGASPICTTALVAANALCTTSALPAGSHTINAHYSGDSTYAPSDAAPLALTVQPPALTPTTLSLAASANPVTAGRTVTFTATVSPSAATGAIAFRDGATTLCAAVAVVAGRAQCSTSSLATGAHAIGAHYSGNSTYAASDAAPLPLTVQAVGIATTTALAASANPALLGRPVTFTATVTPSNATGTIAFRDGTSTICGAAIVSAGRAQCITSTLSAGAHTIRAHYSGDATYAASDALALALTVQVPLAPTTTTLVSSSNPSRTAQPVTFTATVSPASATGTVTFTDGANAMCAAVALTAGQAQCTTGTLAGGTHTIVAHYAGNASLAPSDSAPLAQVVKGPKRLKGISTRMQSLTSDNVIIAGFIISGTANKTVVVRGRGPSLAASGISNALANPTVTLVRASDNAVIGTNDDWANAANATDVVASGYAPSDPAESAILATLSPGAYTAIVSGVGNTTGVAIVEVYEVDQPDAPLTGISTRGQVLTGNDVMIGGFILEGDAPQAVVIRARGPSLAAAGVAGALANPTLTVVSAADNSIVAVNDDWATDPSAAQVQAGGFAPTDGRESAVLLTLPPGGYTVIVNGVGNSVGVGIVEIFTVQ